jgi:NtrC-family two-component system response regulator AlgB
MARLMIVDDEKNIRRHLETFLISCGHEVFAMAGGAEALGAMAKHGAPDLVISDFRMAEMNGLELLNEVSKRYPGTLVILITAFGTIDSAVTAMKAGAYDFITKPFTLDRIRLVIERALEVRALRSENRLLRDALGDAPLIESKSAAMNALIDTARRAAASEATVLLTGESGTGKNVLAREIHNWSERRNRPFVVVNCTTLSENLLESELFGHLRGAFTGAIKDKPGRLEAADGGSVFIDEVADLTPALQTKFLRFLQERRFERVGGQDTIEVDARIIAATNRDLSIEVAAGRFRPDLYYRLNVIALHVPALRDRAEDIPALANRFLAEASARNRRPMLRFSSEAMSALQNYSWPGNVRELRNAIERATVLSRGEIIEKEDLPDPVFRPVSLVTNTPASSRATLDDVEREYIKQVLASAATLEEAADMLGISVATLWRRRRRYGMD